MNHLPRALAVATLIACLCTAAVVSQQHAPKRTPDVIFVPTPQEVVDVMLQMAQVDKNDVVYDLGCGDGRLVITAAKKFGARGVGIDIDPQRIQESTDNARNAGVTDKVKFLEADLFETDISPATVVTLYLLPELNRRLQPKLLASLKPGTPIVSHDFDMGDWKPDEQREVTGPSRTHKVYLWHVPAKAAGVWRWKQGGTDYALRLRQEHQRIEGKITIGSRELYIHEARLSGDKLSFRVEPHPEIDLMTFAGRINGDRITGTWTRQGRSRSTLAWKAERAEAVSALLGQPKH